MYHYEIYLPNGETVSLDATKFVYHPDSQAIEFYLPDSDRPIAVFVSGGWWGFLRFNKVKDG